MGLETLVLLTRVTGSAFKDKSGLTEGFPEITTRIFSKATKFLLKQLGIGVNDF